MVLYINNDHGLGNLPILYEVTCFWLAVIAVLDLQETGYIAQENSAKGKKLKKKNKISSTTLEVAH